MTNACSRCLRSTLAYDDHDLCPQCRIAAGVCTVDVSNPCLTCLRWTRHQDLTQVEEVSGGCKAEGSSAGEAMQLAAPTATVDCHC